MKHEIITLENVQIIGMAKEIAFCKGQEECPKFWGEYVERIIKPVFMEHKAPDAFQQAAIDNGVGEFGLCTSTLPTIIVQPVGRQTLVLAARTPLHTSSAEYIKVVGCLRECSFSLFIVASG